MAGGSSNDDDGMVSGINVTPLVDVTLVLLIIFMVTARIIVSQGMPMDLPKAASGEALQQVFSVELSADGKTRVDSDNLGSDEAITPLAKAAKATRAEKGCIAYDLNRDTEDTARYVVYERWKNVAASSLEPLALVSASRVAPKSYNGLRS